MHKDGPACGWKQKHVKVVLLLLLGLLFYLFMYFYLFVLFYECGSLKGNAPSLGILIIGPQRTLFETTQIHFDGGSTSPEEGFECLMTRYFKFTLCASGLQLKDVSSELFSATMPGTYCHKLLLCDGEGLISLEPQEPNSNPPLPHPRPNISRLSRGILSQQYKSN